MRKLVLILGLVLMSLAVGLLAPSRVTTGPASYGSLQE